MHFNHSILQSLSSGPRSFHAINDQYLLFRRDMDCSTETADRPAIVARTVSWITRGRACQSGVGDSCPDAEMLGRDVTVLNTHSGVWNLRESTPARRMEDTSSGVPPPSAVALEALPCRHNHYEQSHGRGMDAPFSHRTAEPPARARPYGHCFRGKRWQCRRPFLRGRSACGHSFHPSGCSRAAASRAAFGSVR